MSEEDKEITWDDLSKEEKERFRAGDMSLWVSFGRPSRWPPRGAPGTQQTVSNGQDGCCLQQLFAVTAGGSLLAVATAAVVYRLLRFLTTSNN